MKATAIAQIIFKSERHVLALQKALLPESQNKISERSRVSIAKDGSTILLNVEAEDTVALRASLNAYLRWINSADSVLKTLEANT